MSDSRSQSGRVAAFVVAVVLAIILVTVTKDIESKYKHSIVLRDNTATVMAFGEGMEKSLRVNGIGMTSLTPITKMMVHLPLAFLERTPQNGLVLCLGMGTSYRSMLSWGISSTVVELVPSIQKLLPFYQIDGEKLLHVSNGSIIVDDARRFLERSTQIFDVIVVDPPRLLRLQLPVYSTPVSFMPQLPGVLPRMELFSSGFLMVNL